MLAGAIQEVCINTLYAPIASQVPLSCKVPRVIIKKKAIKSEVKSAYWSTTHQYGIKIPKTVEKVLKFDKENANTLWHNAITKEIKNVRVAFEEWIDKENEIPPSYQQIKCHIIFEIKLSENF